MRKAFVCNGWARLLVIYKLLIDVCYLWYIYEPKIWGAPYVADLTPVGYFSSWIVYATINLLFHTTLRKPLDGYKFSEFILLVLLLLSVTPGLSMCGLGAFPREYRLLFYLYWLLVFFLARNRFLQNSKDSAMVGQLSSQAAKGLLLVIGAIVTLTVVFVFFYYAEGKFFVSGLQSIEVYVRRAQFSKIVLMFPLNYIMANSLIVFLVLLLFFLGNRRYGLVGLILLVWYMGFSCGAHKMGVFSIAAGFLIYMLRDHLTIKRMLYIAIGIVLVGMCSYSLWGDIYVMSFLRRELFETNFLSYCYYDFFQKHLPIVEGFWGNPVLSREKIPFMIGSQYLSNSTETHANNGLLGDACLMFGVYGVIISPILWLCYLYVADRASYRLVWWIKLSMSVFWATTMQNGAFATNMLSHGGVVMIVMAYLCSIAKTDTELLNK